MAAGNGAFEGDSNYEYVTQDCQHLRANLELSTRGLTANRLNSVFCKLFFLTTKVLITPYPEQEGNKLMFLSE